MGERMTWVVATDENGVDFPALKDENSGENHDGETYFAVWIFNDKKSGFGDNVGQVSMHRLKHLGDGKYGA